MLCVTFIIASLKFWIPSVVLGMNGEGEDMSHVKLSERTEN